MRLIAFLLLVLAGLTLLLFVPGCSRDYSFEGRDTLVLVAPPVPAPDSIRLDSLPVSGSCAGCSNSLIEGKCSLKVNGQLFCGIIDTAILSLARNTFTFYGPSLCSADSGLIITCFLSPDALNRNVREYTIEKSTLYYYDKVSGLYMVQSQQGKPFRVTVLKYDHDTKLAEGTFGGTVVMRDGKEVPVTEGRWKTHLY